MRSRLGLMTIRELVLNVMEEGRFNLLKYGRDKSIVAETTIIAVANPQDIDYHEYRESISVNEINLLRPLLDRFDQIYVALDKRDPNKDLGLFWQANRLYTIEKTP